MVRLLSLALANTVLYLVLGFRSAMPESARVLPRLVEGTLFESSSEFIALWLALVVVYALAVRTSATRDGRTLSNLILLTSALFRGVLFLGSGFDAESRQALFWAPSPLGAAMLGAVGEDWLRRAFVTGCDLVALAVSASLLRSRKLPAGLLLLHGWNPLVIKEAAGSGRVALVALLLLLVALRYARQGTERLATLALALATTGPAMILATLPALSRTLGARVLWAIAAAGAARYLLFGPASGPTWFGWPPADTLGGSLAPCLTALSSLLITRDPIPPLALGLALWAFVVLRRRARREKDVIPGETVLGLGGLMLVSPQVLPEAFVAVGYLAPYTSNRGWVALTATAPITYLAMETEWSFYLGFAQYFVPLFLLVFFWLGSPPPKTAG